MVIDRIEGTVAVVETEDGYVDVPLSAIRGNARDGAVLVSDGSGGYVVDEGTSSQRARSIEERAARLFTRKRPS